MHLPLTNDVNGSYAPYDKAEDIYKTILDELKDIAPRFRSAAVPKNFSTRTSSTWEIWRNGNAMQTPCACALPCV